MGEKILNGATDRVPTNISEALESRESKLLDQLEELLDGIEKKREVIKLLEDMDEHEAIVLEKENMQLLLEKYVTLKAQHQDVAARSERMEVHQLLTRLEAANKNLAKTQSKMQQAGSDEKDLMKKTLASEAAIWQQEIDKINFRMSLKEQK